MSISFENSQINPLYNSLFIVDTEIEIISDNTNISDPDSDIDESLNLDAECRICLENNSEEELISICECKGSVKYVHKSCIENWINSFPSNHVNHFKCQLCKTNYNLDILEVNVDTSSQSQRQFCIIVTLLYFIILFMIIISLLAVSN